MAGDGRRDQDGTLGVEVAAHQQSQPRRGTPLAVGDDDASGARHVVVRAGHRRAAECQRNRQRRCPRRRQRRRHRDVVAHATLAHQFRGHRGEGQRSRAGGTAIAGLSGRAGGTGVARRRTVLVRWARGAAGRVRARILVRRAVHTGAVGHPPGRAAAARLARPARQPRRASRAGRRRASALLVLGARLAKRLRRVRNAVRRAGVAGPVLLVLQCPAAQRRQDADDEGCQRRLPCLARRADRETMAPRHRPARRRQRDFQTGIVRRHNRPTGLWQPCRGRIASGQLQVHPQLHVRAHGPDRDAQCLPRADVPIRADFDGRRRCPGHRGGSEQPSGRQRCERRPSLGGSECR